MIPQPRFYYDKQNTSRDPSIIKTSWLSWLSYEHQPGMSKGGSMSQRWKKMLFLRLLISCKFCTVKIEPLVNMVHMLVNLHHFR